MTTVPKLCQILPRTLQALADECRNAFHRQDWENCEKLLDELRERDSLTASFWQLRIDDARFRLLDRVKDWKEFEERASRILANSTDASPRPPYKGMLRHAFLRYFSNLLATGDLASALAEVDTFKSTYKMDCPPLFVAFIMTLFMRKGLHRDALNFLDGQEEKLNDDVSRKNLLIKTYENRMFCRKALAINGESSTAHFSQPDNISRGLISLMDQSFLPDTPARTVFDRFMDCWEAMHGRSEKELLDVMHCPDELSRLETMIENALTNKTPFSLVRVGEGESYAFCQLAAERFPSEALRGIEENQERHWWGEQSIRQSGKKSLTGF